MGGGVKMAGMKNHALSFSVLPEASERELLGRTAEWRWISTLEGEGKGAVKHPVHERWMEGKGNTYAPPLREVMLTFRGQAVHSLGERVYERRPGTVMLFDHYESRDLRGADHKTGFHTLWLHFHSRQGLTCNSNSCDERGRYFQEIPTRVVTGPQVATAMDAWDRARSEPGEALYRALLRAQLTALLLEVLGRGEANAPAQAHRQVVEAVKLYIDTHLADPLPLHGLAQIAGYSPFFFHRLFVKYTGQTPVDYINDARLEQAKRLLLEGYTVAAAAEGVGFASGSYFSDLFRRHAGCPPRQWANVRLSGVAYVPEHPESSGDERGHRRP